MIFFFPFYIHFIFEIIRLLKFVRVSKIGQVQTPYLCSCVIFTFVEKFGMIKSKLSEMLG